MIVSETFIEMHDNNTEIIFIPRKHLLLGFDKTMEAYVSVLK